MKYRYRHIVTALLLIALLPVGCAIPDEPPAVAPAAPVSFTPQERDTLFDFYEKYEFPPEIADPSVIAADLEEQLEATAKVPPDVAGVPLPVELERRLAPLPPGFVRFRAGTAVILMDVRTREVIDQIDVQFPLMRKPPDDSQ